MRDRDLAFCCVELTVKNGAQVQKAYADQRQPKHREVVARFNELQDKAYPIGM